MALHVAQASPQLHLFSANPDRYFKRHKPRCEFKYQILASQMPAIKAFIAPYCNVDPFVGDASRYTITSLYLDSPDRKLYWATENQHQNRFKLRVRTYGMKSDGPVFLEIKRRFGDAQSKSRVQVPRAEWQAALLPGGQELFEQWRLSDKMMGMVRDFSALCGGWALEPAVCVRYDRDPFVGRLNPEIRITFDQAIRCFGTRKPVLHAFDEDYLPVDFPFTFDAPEPRLVLEIKFDMVFPIWLADLVAHFDLKREAFAKYCSSINRLENDKLRYRTDDRGARWED